MTIDDFEISTQFNDEYTTKERFYFENDVVKFWYKWKIATHQYQDGWSSSDNWKTKYQLILLIDIDDIDNKPLATVFNFFIVKQTEKKGLISIPHIEQLIKWIDKINIEKHIKENKYQQLKYVLSM